MRPLLRTLLKFPTGYDAGIKTRSNCGLVHIDPDKHNLGLTVTDDWVPALVKTSAILIGLEVGRAQSGVDLIDKVRSWATLNNSRQLPTGTSAQTTRGNQYEQRLD